MKTTEEFETVAIGSWQASAEVEAFAKAQFDWILQEGAAYGVSTVVMGYEHLLVRSEIDVPADYKEKVRTRMSQVGLDVSFLKIGKITL